MRVMGSTTTRFMTWSPQRQVLPCFRRHSQQVRCQVSGTARGAHGRSSAELDSIRGSEWSAGYRSGPLSQKLASRQPMQPWPEPIGRGYAVVPLGRRAGIVRRRAAAPHLVKTPALARALVIPGLYELAGVEECAPIALVVQALAVEHLGTAERDRVREACRT